MPRLQLWTIHKTDIFSSHAVVDITPSVHMHEKHFVREEIKRRHEQRQRHLEKWETSAIMKDDIYAFRVCLTLTMWDIQPLKVSPREREMAENRLLTCAGGFKFSNSWHKKGFQMSQYLLGHNTSSERTTFVNETNTFGQHVDRSPVMWLRGPRKGSRAKLQYFSKRPPCFSTPNHYWNAFLKVFNLHPNAAPLFNSIYSADTEAISVTEVNPQAREGSKITKHTQHHFTFICPSYELSW